MMPGSRAPSAADPERNPHRTGAGWTLRTVAAILADPRYTGRQVWNRQRTDFDLADPANTGLGHKQVQRWKSFRGTKACSRMTAVGHTVMPRSARWGDGEHLAAGNHEVIRMARMPDFGKSGLERRLEHRGWVAGAQLKPGAQARLLVFGCVVGELDAEMSPPGKLTTSIG